MSHCLGSNFHRDHIHELHLECVRHRHRSMDRSPEGLSWENQAYAWKQRTPCSGWEDAPAPWSGNQGLKSAVNSKLCATCLSPVFIQATLNNILLGIEVTEIVETHQTPKKYIKLPLCFQVWERLWTFAIPPYKNTSVHMPQVHVPNNCHSWRGMCEVVICYCGKGAFITGPVFPS